ncbi:MAG: hypothetical protein IPG79_04540 [Saprospiraceae bacterium]|nr:hypothetical protein [Saprospiraceae bacterium]
MNNITKQSLKVKISLILVISTCFLFISAAQQRVTDINNGGTKVVTFLSQYNNDNYIITVTPEDKVSFYLLNEENEKELIRQVIIPFAYITKMM